MKTLLTMGLQHETAGRSTLAIYSSVCFCAHIIVTVSAVNFATDCLRHYVRVHLLSYHAFSSLDHWDVDHRELGYVYYSNIASFSSPSCAHILVADKEEDCHQA